MNWRNRLDARVDRCPECDGWRWDRLCMFCTGPVDNNLSVITENTQDVPKREEAA